jgi:alpha-tubulin suppressor-like RCC1 family protein
MDARYTRLFMLPQNLYFYGSPIVISAGALLKDNKMGRVVVQLKLRNIQSKYINAVTVQVFPADIAGRKLGTDLQYQYLDLLLSRDSEFGQKIPIILPDTTTRSFSVCVREVIFVDQSIWKTDIINWKPMERRIPLNEVILERQLERQYRIKYGNQCKEIFQQYQDLWYCSCGALNRKEEMRCHSCGLETEVLASVDLIKLKEELDKRLAEEAMLQEKQKIEKARKQAIEKEEQEKRAKEKAKKMKRIKMILGIGMTAMIAITSIWTGISNYIEMKEKEALCFAMYDEAVTLLDSGKYDEAIILFEKLGNYKDSNMQLEKAKDKRKESREVIYKGERKSISLGKEYTVALCSDGTVIAAGRNTNGRCNVSKWTNIISVAAGGEHTVALCSDGTVVAVGKNKDGQCDASKWKNIVAVAAGNSHTVALYENGTVEAIGQNNFGQCDVSKWEDIVAISAGTSHTIGLRLDGTVIAVGRNNFGQCDVSEWKDIIAISAGTYHTVGLRSDGTVVVTGLNGNRQRDVSKWNENIIGVAAGAAHTVGLCSDGTVVSAGDNNDKQCDVSKWTDIVAIAAGEYHTVGLCSDGTVVATGRNDEGECDVSDWNNIKLPDSY